MLGDGTLSFLKAKEDFKRQIHFNGTLYSDIHPINPTSPYFHVAEELRPFSPEGLHLIVCVHGLDGNSADLRLVKTYLELVLPGSNLDFLMSERNQVHHFTSFRLFFDCISLSEISFNVFFIIRSTGWNVQHIRRNDRQTRFGNLLLSGGQQSQSEKDQFRRSLAWHYHYTIGSHSTANATAAAQTPHFPLTLWATSGHPIQFFRIGQHGYVFFFFARVYW